MNTQGWQPTARLRFVERWDPAEPKKKRADRILQQWWAPPAPSYMLRDTDGEWRDVEVYEPPQDAA